MASGITVSKDCGTDCWESVYTIDSVPSGGGRIYWCDFDSIYSCNSAGVEATYQAYAYVAGNTVQDKSLRMSVDPDAIPLDSFTGADNWDAPVGNLCTTVQVGFQYDGDAVDPADYHETLYPSTALDPAQRFVGVAVVTDHDWTSDLTGVALSYRWGSRGVYTSVTNPIDTAVVTGGSAMTFRPESQYPRYLDQLEIRCQAAGETWWLYLEEEDPVNSPTWRDTEVLIRLCSSISIFRGCARVG